MKKLILTLVLLLMILAVGSVVLADPTGPDIPDYGFTSPVSAIAVLT